MVTPQSTYPTLAQVAVTRDHVALSHRTIRALAAFAEQHPDAAGVLMEIHSHVDPVEPPIYTARTIAGSDGPFTGPRHQIA